MVLLNTPNRDGKTGDCWKAGGQGFAWPTPRPTARSTWAGYLCRGFCALVAVARTPLPAPGFPAVAGTDVPARVRAQKLHSANCVRRRYRQGPLSSLPACVPASTIPIRSPQGGDRRLPACRPPEIARNLRHSYANTVRSQVRRQSRRLPRGIPPLSAPATPVTQISTARRGRIAYAALSLRQF